MTDATLVLSKENQDKVTARADEIATRSNTSAKKAFLATLGTAAVAAALFVALPLTTPVLIAGTIAGVISFFAGARATGHYLTGKAMDGVKKDAGTEGFVDKMKARAQRFTKIHKVAEAVSAFSGLAMIANFAIGLIFPPVAPITALLHTPLLWGWIGTGTVRDSLKPARESAVSLNEAVEQKAPKDSLVAILQPSGEGAAKLANTPAPGKAFDAAAKTPANDKGAPAKQPVWKRALGM